MSFTDFYFYPAAAFLIGTLLILQAVLRGKGRLSNAVSKALLLVFSYFVMYLFDGRFCLCITMVIGITYGGARLIGRSEGKGKVILTTVTVTILLAILGVFKYLNFFMEGVMAVAGKQWTALAIILPVGISFYIFSAVGYVLDVSWGIMEPECSLLDVALYLCFFPKLVCGPIVAAGDFLPQLKENRRITFKNVEAGIQIFVFGLFKKMVLADHLGVFVDQVFAAPAAFGTMTVWWAVFSYFLQLYFDFSGYSDMAIGISKLLGYDLGRNFNLPFVSRNISDFWDRWHMTLTAWLNGYLFNPLALRMRRKVGSLPKGKRKKYKNFPTYAAMLLTFLVSGLWHGAGTTFLVWGMCQGIYSVIHAVYANRTGKKHRNFVGNKRGWTAALDILANYFVLNLIQVFFRAESVGQAFYILGRMFTPHAGIAQPYTWTFLAYILLAAATFAAYRRSRRSGRETEGYYPIMDLNTVKGLTVFFIFCGLTVMLAYYGETYFIYGKF